jgi:hypothetical protein
VKKLIASISASLAYFSLALPAFAQNVSPCSGANGIAGALCSLGGNNVSRTIRNVVIFIVVLAVVICLLYLLYGGIKWITSRGEKTQVEEARNHIMAAIIGLIVVFLAIFILSIILTVFGVDIMNLALPTIAGNNVTP